MHTKRIGQIRNITRYPVKSMAGSDTVTSPLGWHGLAGDRRYGLCQAGNNSGFPWLSASKLPELLLYQPCEFDETCGEPLPSRVRAPSGDLYEIGSDQLRNEIKERIGCDVQMMALKHGIFDDAPISIITSPTISRVCEEAGIATDRRRFRANIVANLNEPVPFAEDDWVGRVIAFGKTESAPAVFVTKRDVRCAMIGLDPDTAERDPSALKATTRLNENNAGVYGSVVRTGPIRVGDSIFLLDA